MKKSILKRTADIMEKLAVAGIAISLYQGKASGIWMGSVFLVLSYLFTVWEAKQ